jgi:hypothetical protein
VKQSEIEVIDPQDDLRFRLGSVATPGGNLDSQAFIVIDTRYHMRCSDCVSTFIEHKACSSQNLPITSVSLFSYDLDEDDRALHLGSDR